MSKGGAIKRGRPKEGEIRLITKAEYALLKDWKIKRTCYIGNNYFDQSGQGHGVCLFRKIDGHYHYYPTGIQDALTKILFNFWSK